MKNQKFDLEDLISRMCLREPLVSSQDSKSWHAHREAERLSDPVIIEAISRYLASETTPQERENAYFILGKLGKNLSSKAAVQLLLKSISCERDKNALAKALNMISELSLSDDDDLSLIFNLLNDKRWLVRHAAIRALKASCSRHAEQQLIMLLEKTDDADDKVYCHSTLGSIGSERSLPALQANTTSRKRDVKISAVVAIEKIQARINAS